MIQKSIDIWEGFDFVSKSTVNPRPKLTTYILSGEKVRGAVLILPGGSYEFTSPREAEPVALQYTAAGYNAFVLEYSVAPNRFPQALQDTCRALTMIRQHAADWHTDADKIAVCGFSAGGHLAASHAVFWNRPELFSTAGLNNKSVKPNALILAYPVITSGEFRHDGSIQNLLGADVSPEMLEMISLENQVSACTPPTFIWHTFEDEGVPLENSLLYASALRKHNIPFELHIYPQGSHGLSLASKETANEMHIANSHIATWLELSIEWLKLTFNETDL
ncbi:MAG: alpha/beta hydrolase [Anaerolineaceae bacterium]|nr:alpha/beta hydrolase [Anaerolineaceae bacterium]